MVTMKMIRLKNGGFFLFFLLLNSFTLLSSSQSTPQSYYPYVHPPPSTTPPPLPLPNSPSPSRASTHKIIVAVGATAASTLVVAGVFFLLCSSCFGPRRRTESAAESNQTHPLPLSRSEFARFGPNVKGLIVDEDGLDVLYWRKLRDNSGGFRKEPFDRARVGNGNGSGNGNGNGNGRMEMEHITRGRSSSSHGQIHPGQRSDGGGVGRPPLAPPAPPPPPPPLPVKKIPAIPPPPPVPKKKAPMPPPPPPRKAGSGDSSSKPPAAPKPPSTVEDDEGGKDQVTLKPLHWEKLNVDTDHSIVWDKIQKGSFQYNGDMMEAMFGVLATNRKSPKQESPITKPGESSNPKIVILDPRRSQNTAIVLKSLGVPRTELTESLLSGKGLALETLEKLARSAPTPEEESQIVTFDGDVRNLSYAESFLHELLTAVPSAFTRANAMLFKLSYDHEILGVKESLQTMELACSEMRSRAIFLKLLEAILKAGNRLNAGTARGDAKAFNLNTLLKLSDYKSSDGKTTLLHFVVHEVVRTEGRRCVLSKTATQPEDSTPKEDKEKEFLKLGLPIVGGLSSDFSNVKKAAFIDYDGLKNTLACLQNRVDSTRELVSKCKSGGHGGGGFLREMKDFLESAEAEIKIIQEEHVRVMSLVKKTTQYYQAGASSESNPLQLFFIVKGFLGMVDQACVEIARSLQQKKAVTAKTSVNGSGSGASQSEVLRTRVTFPRLPEHFLSYKSSASDSEDEP